MRTFITTSVAGLLAASALAAAAPLAEARSLTDAEAKNAARLAVAPEPAVDVLCFRAPTRRGKPEKRRALCLVGRPRPDGLVCDSVVEVKVPRGEDGAIRTHVVRLNVCMPPHDRKGTLDESSAPTAGCPLQHQLVARRAAAACGAWKTQLHPRREILYAAAKRRDFDSVLMGWDPGSEYHPSGDLLPPDLETVFYGHDGYRQLWRYWLDPFEDIRWDPEGILDFGDKFLVTTQQRGRGSGSGVAVSEPVFQLFTMRRGLVVRQENFLDPSKAIEAAARE